MAIRDPSTVRKGGRRALRNGRQRTGLDRVRAIDSDYWYRRFTRPLDDLHEDGHGLQRLEYGRPKRMAAMPAAARGVPVDAQASTMNSAHIVGVTIASLACVTDLRTRRIPNVLTFGAAAGRVAVSVSQRRYRWTRSCGARLARRRGRLHAALRTRRPRRRGREVARRARSVARAGRRALAVALYRGRRRRHGACRVGEIRISRHRHRRMSGCSSVTGASPGSKRVPAITLEHSAGPKLAYAFPILTGMVATIWLR